MDEKTFYLRVEDIFSAEKFNPRQQRLQLSLLIQEYCGNLYRDWIEWIRIYQRKRLIEKSIDEVWDELDRTNLQRLKSVRDTYFWMMLDIIFTEKTQYLRRLYDNQTLRM